MSIQNPYQAYKQNSVNTASPGELTLMLYNGSLKFISIAKNAIQVKNYEERNINLQKAQAIIQELMLTLNMDVQISKNLLALYDFIHHKLVEANIRNDLDILSEAEGMIVELRDTWKEAIKLDRQKKHAEGEKV